jgi:four helix bundle protein
VGGSFGGDGFNVRIDSKSPADFIAKINTVEEEADETLFWLELLTESGMVSAGKLERLIREADELTAIFTASGKTAKHNKIRRGAGGG